MKYGAVIPPSLMVFCYLVICPCCYLVTCPPLVLNGCKAMWNLGKWLSAFYQLWRCNMSLYCDLVTSCNLHVPFVTLLHVPLLTCDLWLVHHSFWTAARWCEIWCSARFITLLKVPLSPCHLVTPRGLCSVHHLFWTAGVKFRKVVQCTLSILTLLHVSLFL